jgi:outer membrane lipoprotein-sorting protein
MMRRSILLFILILILGLPSVLHAQSGADIDWLTRVQDRYYTLDGLRAEYEQTVTSPLDDGTTERTGMLYATPEAFRVEGDGQTIVSNPTTTYVYNRMRGQVIVSDAEANDGDWARPTTLFAQFSDAFTLEASESASNGTRRLTLQATDDQADYETLVLWVRERDTVITQLELTDFSGTHIRIRLNAIALNPDFADDLFTFEPPAGAEVVDLREDA